MISVIICSVNALLRTNVKKNIEETIGIEHEIIVIENEQTHYSISKAYNIGATQSKYPFLCFVHEDIIFHTKGWGNVLINQFSSTKARLIGILGCIIKTSALSSVHIPKSEFNRHNQLQRYANNVIDHFYQNPHKETFSEVCVLDGVFMASLRTAWEETKFSEEYLTGFHGYDIDFSLKNFKKGRVIVIYDLLIEHLSLGSFNKSWIDAQLALHAKWKHFLPLTTSGVTRKNARKAEVINLKELLLILIRNNYRRDLQFVFFLKLLFRNIGNPMNFFFVRKVIIGNAIDNKIKSIFKRTVKRISIG